MKYTYNEMPDKSKQGIKNEVSKGLAIIAFYFQTVLGIPLDTFEDMLEKRCKNDADKLFFYINFRNDKPEIFIGH